MTIRVVILPGSREFIANTLNSGNGTGDVTTIRVRFAAQDGTPYPFDATTGPGYVWHCHIIDHEDNEMMRPYQVVP